MGSVPNSSSTLPYSNAPSLRCLSLRPLRPLREALLASCVLDQRPGCFPGLHRRQGRADCMRVYNRAFHQKRELIR
jgi:hypothetical protein